MKKLELSLLIGLLLAVTATLFSGFTDFGAECEQINGKLLRLHVIANSDSDADQNVKLAVRDHILEQCGSLLFEGTDKEQAKTTLSSRLPELERAANELLAEEGFAYTAHASIEKRWFDTRGYDAVTLPAGRYDALCIHLGEGQGHNWWCVVFPPMCLPAACEEEELAKVLNDDELRIVTESGSYAIRFKLFELYEVLKNRA
ncbi:MAG: stage II sporulation protein R [Acetanaerobacterium sp.]